MENIINTKQLCDWLGISESTAYEWRKTKNLPYKKISKKIIKYNTAEVQEWLDKNSINAADYEPNQSGDTLKENLSPYGNKSEVDYYLADSLREELRKKNTGRKHMSKEEIDKYVDYELKRINSVVKALLEESK